MAFKTPLNTEQEINNLPVTTEDDDTDDDWPPYELGYPDEEQATVNKTTDSKSTVIATDH
ncbi:hypothetical protein DFH07DRAFT_962984 [Mycena maculata]|uniref:Uncharacterized protein n=1 Tax=Mycena maculata TaxID=230809 RepID=A0AAD7IPS7_9AGAR|nr:hypothetical protein DFH07DRAFT_962984 [Mycena maculata]